MSDAHRVLLGHRHRRRAVFPISINMNTEWLHQYAEMNCESHSILWRAHLLLKLDTTCVRDSNNRLNAIFEYNPWSEWTVVDVRSRRTDRPLSDRFVIKPQALDTFLDISLQWCTGKTRWFRQSSSSNLENYFVKHYETIPRHNQNDSSCCRMI